MKVITKETCEVVVLGFKIKAMKAMKAMKRWLGE